MKLLVVVEALIKFEVKEVYHVYGGILADVNNHKNDGPYIHVLVVNRPDGYKGKRNHTVDPGIKIIEWLQEHLVYNEGYHQLNKCSRYNFGSLLNFGASACIEFVDVFFI